MAKDRITVIVGTDLKQKIKLYCVEKQINISEFIIKIIKQNLK